MIVLLTPGLSVIIDAIQESRKILPGMNTMPHAFPKPSALFFMTLSILAFNFYPVTAVMIVCWRCSTRRHLSIASTTPSVREKPEA